MSREPEIACMFVHSESMGYGRMAMRLVPAIAAQGVRVQDGLEDGPTAHALWMSTPAHAREWYHGQTIHIITMWETMRLAEGMAEGLLNFDTIIVPSQQNVELFSEHHPNVKLALLGVDEQWSYRPRKEPGIYFNFLCAGSGPRKGTDLAHAAFLKVFGDYQGDGPIPRLIMKNPRTEPFHGPNVEVIGGKISAEAELDLYADAHCYLQPSRGEGFGLQPLQAIAQGCPTILTDAHGHASFAHLGYGLSWKPSPAAYFSHGPAGEWWEPNFDELCERMKWVYDNYEQATAFAKTAAQVAGEQFTWANSARQVIDAIGETRLCEPYTGSGGRVRAQLKRYKVIVNRQWRAEIAGINYLFEPEQVYYEPADVLRILYDAGLLDPACLVDNLGLTEHQLARMPEYSASHSYCPNCLQRYGDQPTRAEDMFNAREVERLTARVAELEAGLVDR